MNKTDRHRGRVYMLIRKIASFGHWFSLEDLCPPLDWRQASTNCNQLVRNGELKALRRPIALYHSTPQLRPWDLTKRWFRLPQVRAAKPVIAQEPLQAKTQAHFACGTPPVSLGTQHQDIVHFTHQYPI